MKSLILVLAALLAVPHYAQDTQVDEVGLYFSLFSGDNSTRRSQIVQQLGGWRGYIESRVEPAVEWAHASDQERKVVVWLQNPFGTLRGEEMQLTQYVDAIQADLHWLVADYVPAWKEFAERWPEVEVIAYTGKASASPVIEDFIAKGPPYDPWWLISLSDQPMLDAGHSRGLDAISSSPQEGIDREHAESLRDRGVRVIGEFPGRVGEWQSEYPGVLRYDRLDWLFDPEQQRPFARGNWPTWDEVAWPAYVDKGIYVILAFPTFRRDDANAMRLGVQEIIPRGFIPLIQPSPGVMDQPIDWYFEGAN